ncbi:MAG: polyphosphate kinase [Gammaproteobacteria bacterium]|nr:polyphosphate kinase [Gammaproteobacteria bacterium]
MFSTAELGQKLSKKEFKKIETVLRRELLEAQRQLRERALTPVIIIFAGVDGAGKGMTVNRLNEWMDTRWLINRAYREPTDEEIERPEFWRYWRDLPPKGRIGLFLSAWYSKPVLDQAYGNTSIFQLDKRIDRILAFENALAEDGALILKFWMHLSRDAQEIRYKMLEKDPLLSWKVTKKDWDHWRRYDTFIAAAERVVMRTNMANAKWTIVEGSDDKFSGISVANTILDALRKQLDKSQENNNTTTPMPNTTTLTHSGNPQKLQSVVNVKGKPQRDNKPVQLLSSKTVFSHLDMSPCLNKPDYKLQLKTLQARLNLLHRNALQIGISTIVIFEGPDAAGKGGAIRRMIPALDPHIYQVLPFAAPTEEERAQHYLWRFWRHLPRAGHVTIFDRSWYGRVLVERVEGFATEQEWCRAYSEINDFEEQLVMQGSVLVKFWIHITKKEQLKRFKARQKTPYKNWKLTDEDWRNRAKWKEYEMAAHDMVQYTSLPTSPWVLVEGNNKYFARIKVLQTLVNAIEKGIASVVS